MLTTSALPSSTYISSRLAAWLAVTVTDITSFYSALMGLFAFLATSCLSSKCELNPVAADKEREAGEAAEGLLEDDNDHDDEMELSPVHANHRHSAPHQATPKPTSKIAQVSKETRSIMYALWFLLMVDSLADGMVSMSLTTYYMDQKFSLPKSTLGDVLSASYFLAALSTVFAGPLARHIGLVNTMVFTHIPSSLAVLLFPLPQNKILTFALLLLRVVSLS